MDVDLGQFGLRTGYTFKQYHVPATFEAGAYLATVREQVWPALHDLEQNRLVAGFHFIPHERIDVRLSADWDRNGPRIIALLGRHGVSQEMEEWSMEAEKYGGPIGLMLSYNQLEFNSRLIAALAHTLPIDESVRKAADGLATKQWVHYLYVQYGLSNQQHAVAQLEDALGWLERLRPQNPAFVEQVFRQLEQTIASASQT